MPGAFDPSVLKCRAVVVSSARSVHFLRRGEWACSRCPFVVIYPVSVNLRHITHYVGTIRPKKIGENTSWMVKHLLLILFRKCRVPSDCLLSFRLCLARGGSASVWSINISRLPLESGRLVALARGIVYPVTGCEVLSWLLGCRGKKLILIWGPRSPWRGTNAIFLGSWIKTNPKVGIMCLCFSLSKTISALIFVIFFSSLLMIN